MTQPSFLTRFVGRIGRTILNFVGEVGSLVRLLGAVLRYTPRIVKDRKLVLEQMAIVGADSLPLVVLIGAFTGAIAALQATNLFAKFNLIGIARPFIGGSIATVVFTELTPVLTALVIAGRVGGSMTAQIGTMQVSEQIDALEMMAIDKNRYLSMPRVIAALTMMPVLAVFSNIVAIAGAYFLTSLKL
jgi:phospholipid/cholesterol/gamma-HCH transport system permease protein